MVRCIETIGPREVSLVEAECARLRVHQRDERRPIAMTHILGKSVRRVVRTLDEGSLDEVVDGDVLARGEVDRRLADGSGVPPDGDDVAQLRVLEDNEHRH